MLTSLSSRHLRCSLKSRVSPHNVYYLDQTPGSRSVHTKLTNYYALDPQPADIPKSQPNGKVEIHVGLLFNPSTTKPILDIRNKFLPTSDKKFNDVCKLQPLVRFATRDPDEIREFLSTITAQHPRQILSFKKTKLLKNQIGYSGPYRKIKRYRSVIYPISSPLILDIITQLAARLDITDLPAHLETQCRANDFWVNDNDLGFHINLYSSMSKTDNNVRNVAANTKKYWPDGVQGVQVIGIYLARPNNSPGLRNQFLFPKTISTVLEASVLDSKSDEAKSRALDARD